MPRSNLPILDEMRGSMPNSVEQIRHSFDLATPEYNVLNFGDKVDAATTQTAVTAAEGDGGATVLLPPGSFTFDAPITFNSGPVRFIGAGVGVTTLVLASGVNNHMLSMLTATDVEISHLTLDGNRAGQSAGHGIRCDGTTRVWVHHVRILNAYDYGIGLQSGTMTGLWINDVEIDGSGNDGIDFKNKNDDNARLFLGSIAINNHGTRFAGGSKAGIDVRGPVQLSDIVVTGMTGANTGIRFRIGEDASVNGRGGHESSLAGFRIVGTDVANSIGVDVGARDVNISNGYIQDCATGIVSAEEATFGAGHNTIRGVTAKSCGIGFFTKASTIGTRFGHCTALDCTTDGFRIDGSEEVEMSHCRADNATTRGIYLLNNTIATRLVENEITNNTSGVTIAAGITGTILKGNRYSGNSVDITDLAADTHAWDDEIGLAAASVASATTITLPSWTNFITITGTTNIDTITASASGRVVYLKFSAGLTVGDLTGNINLPAAFVATANDVLVLVYDGANWLGASPASVN